MSELGLTPLGYGTADLGNHRCEMSDEQADLALEAAWASGVRHFDSAPHYGLGLAETRLGRFLRAKPRDAFTVSTKVGRRLEATPENAGDLDDGGFVVPATHRRVWDFSEAGVRRSLDESLVRLGLDHVDVAYLHDPERWDLERGLADGLSALAEVCGEGRARAMGVGSMDMSALLAAARTDVADQLMVAGRFTLVDQTGVAELLDLCRSQGIGLVAAAVFNGGLLAGPLTASSTYDYAAVPPAVLARARRIGEICESYGVPLRAAALQYPLRQPGVRTVVVGGRIPDHVRQNAADLEHQVPDALWTELHAERLIEV